MKLYLTECYYHIDFETHGGGVIGVYSTKELAIEAAKKDFDSKKMEKIEDDVELNDIELTYNLIYKLAGHMSKQFEDYEVSVSEIELDKTQ